MEENRSSIRDGLIGLALCLGLLSLAFTGSDGPAALIGLLVAASIAIAGVNWEGINDRLVKLQEKWLSH